MEPSSSIYPLTYKPIYSETISPIPSPFPYRLMKFIRVEFPPLQFSPSPTFQTSSIPLHQTGPAVLLLHMPTTTRTAVLSLLPSVVSIVNGDHKPKSSELLSPSRETSSSAGGCVFPTCRFLYSFSSSLSSGFTQCQVVSNRFWSFSFGFSSTTLYLKIWCQPAYFGRFFSLMFRFTHNSKTTGLIDLFK